VCVWGLCACACVGVCVCVCVCVYIYVCVYVCVLHVGRYSSVGILTRYGLDGPVIFEYFRKICREIQVSLKSDNNSAV